MGLTLRTHFGNTTEALGMRKRKKKWHLEELWGLDKESSGFNPKMKMDKTFNCDRFYSQKNTKELYQYPIKSSDIHGWYEPIDDMVFLGNGRENMSSEFVCAVQKNTKKNNII